MTTLTRDDINHLFRALNDREGVLSTDYEIAYRKTGSLSAQTQAIREEMAELRKVAEKLEALFRAS